MIEELLDSLSDSVSEIFGNTDADVSALAESACDSAKKKLGSILDGNFSAAGMDFSSLFSDDMSSGVDPFGPEAETSNPASGYNVSFGGLYTQSEIDKFKDDMEKAQYELSCRESDVSNCESKVSLNNTTKGKENGDYQHAVKLLDQAKSARDAAKTAFESAKSKYYNAK